MPKRELRPLPEAPKHHLDESGRLFGPYGQVRPFVPKKCRVKTARYSVLIGDQWRHVRVSDMMRRVWGVDFLPTEEWVTKVRAEVSDAKQAEQDAARRRAKAATRARAEAAKAASGAEQWRPIPEDGRYELSNRGRMRGPFGLLMPMIKGHGRPTSASYAIQDPRQGRTKAVMIMVAMRRVWDMAINPDAAWVERIRAEVSAEKVKAGPAAKPRKNEALVLARAKGKRLCCDCGKPLPEGYWRRHPECWAKLRNGFDLPLDEYGALAGVRR